MIKQSKQIIIPVGSGRVIIQGGRLETDNANQVFRISGFSITYQHEGETPVTVVSQLAVWIPARERFLLGVFYQKHFVPHFNIPLNQNAGLNNYGLWQQYRSQLMEQGYFTRNEWTKLNRAHQFLQHAIREAVELALTDTYRPKQTVLLTWRHTQNVILGNDYFRQLSQYIWHYGCVQAVELHGLYSPGSYDRLTLKLHLNGLENMVTLKPDKPGRLLIITEQVGVTKPIEAVLKTLRFEPIHR